MKRIDTLNDSDLIIASKIEYQVEESNSQELINDILIHPPKVDTRIIDSMFKDESKI